MLTNAGKSTTSSMLAYVLHAMGNDLTAVIGAWVPQVGLLSLSLRSVFLLLCFLCKDFLDMPLWEFVDSVCKTVFVHIRAFVFHSEIFHLHAKLSFDVTAFCSLLKETSSVELVATLYWRYPIPSHLFFLCLVICMSWL